MDSLSIAEVKRRFSELVCRTSAGERFLILRQEKPLAVLIGSEELNQLERSAQLGRRLALALGQHSDILTQIEQGKLHPAMAAFGLWKDEEDLTSLVEEITANREAQPERTDILL